MFCKQKRYSRYALGTADRFDALHDMLGGKGSSKEDFAWAHLAERERCYCRDVGNRIRHERPFWNSMPLIKEKEGISTLE